MARPVILVTRPADDAGSLTAALDRLGCDSLLAPMLRIQPNDAAPFDLGDGAAFLFTSANGVRALARRAGLAGVLPQALALPAYGVGDATAKAARDAGFAEVESAGGDVYALAELAAVRRRPQDGPLLHVAGTDVAGDLAGMLGDRGFCVRRFALYQAVAADQLDPAAYAALANGTAAGVTFFSPRTARSFVSLAVDAAATNRSPALCRNTVAYCLSEAVAAALRDGGAADAQGDPLGWAAVRVASTPDQDSLLALLAEAGLAEAGAA